MSKKSARTVATPEQISAELMKRFGQAKRDVHVTKRVKSGVIQDRFVPDAHRCVEMGSAKQVLSNLTPHVQPD